MVYSCKNVLITGCAGFIGSALCEKFLKNNYKVIGLDNINEYYDTRLKKARLEKIIENNINLENWQFIKCSIEDKKTVEKIFFDKKPDIVINLAAQAGVRYSIDNPASYMKSNMDGFFNILEMCRLCEVEHLVYASSSSVYGAYKEYPFKENQLINKPLSFYAATKISNEMMSHSYSNIYKLPITGLRYFTVYGPWGRPDMAPMIFSKNIISRKPISIYNYGKMSRDFTYIQDIVEGTFLCALKAPKINSKDSNDNLIIPNNLFNIGFGKPVNIEYFIELLEDAFSIKAIKEYEKIQPGDVKRTFADTTSLEKWTGYKPKISLEEGVSNFAKWYMKYFKN